jgi:hypothetical protein
MAGGRTREGLWRHGVGNGGGSRLMCEDGTDDGGNKLMRSCVGTGGPGA